MPSLGRAFLAGAAAGAAGTTALNGVTYLDMAVRGRPASSTPEDTVDRLTAAAGIDIPGEGKARHNRLSGVAALTGLLTGVSVGALAGLLTTKLRLPPPVLSILIGAAAMAGSNIPMTALGVTDPRTWDATSWVSDVVPHLAYGVVTAAVLTALNDGRPFGASRSGLPLRRT
jgi:ribose/xylose/arabinose/galactoside ABC-type transport system permease subunit